MAKPNREAGASSIRAFLAVEISDEIRAAAGGLIEEMSLPQYDVKWVRPGNVHVTIKFFGTIDPAQVTSIADVMESIGREWRPFEISVERVGVFPDLRRPRIVWLGIGEGRKNLERLSREAEEALRPVGFPPERRPFKGHLTIGRVRSQRGGAELARQIERRRGFRAGRAVVSELVLFRSDLRPGGAVYTPLERRLLSKQGKGAPG